MAGMTRGALGMAVLTCVLGLGCERSAESKGDLQENVEKTVGAPQESQGMFGGNSAPDRDSGSACCSNATDAGTAGDSAAP